MSFEAFNFVQAAPQELPTGYTNVDEQMGGVMGAAAEVSQKAFEIAGIALVPGVVIAGMLLAVWQIAGAFAKNKKKAD